MRNERELEICLRTVAETEMFKGQHDT